MNTDRVYDLIVIGAGPAGITAGIYAARKQMDCIILSIDVGGQTSWSGDIENYTGYQLMTGVELVAKFEEHMRKYGIDVRENEGVENIRKEDGIVEVETIKGTYASRAVIIASGKKSKELQVSGEKEFRNRGLTYCATCDGPLFAGKDVAIVGGGNSALDAALQLIKIADKIHIINISPALQGDMVMREKVLASDKVSVKNGSRVIAVTGDKFVSGIKIENGKEESEIPVQGVFVEIGLIPNSAFVGDVETNEQGEIKVDSHNKTNISGIFAAGDVTDVPEKQIIVAAGEGSKAALGVFKYLSRQE